MAREVAPQPVAGHELSARALFVIVYAPAVAAIYFALGYIAERSLGWTPLVALAATFMLMLTAWTYAEGASVHPERGGSTVFARYAFNELLSFVAGWVVVLDYIILIAVTTLTAALYLGALGDLADPGAVQIAIALCAIAFVAATNAVGLRASRFRRLAVLIGVDLAVLTVAIVLGIVLMGDPKAVTDPSAFGGSPVGEDVLYALTLAAIAFIGCESAAGVADEVSVTRRALRRVVVAGLAATLLVYVGISVVAVSVLPVDAAGGLPPRALEAPVLVMVRAYEPAWLGEVLRYTVAIVAALVLVAAANTAMLGLSRLGYSLATNRQIPSAVGRLHPTRATPVVIIAIAAVLAAALVLPLDVEFLIGTYAFGALLAFTIAHLSVIVMRFREPLRPRAFRVPFSISLGGVSIPLPAVLGAVVSAASWVALLVLHDTARIAGPLWLAGGLVLYLVYRRSGGKPLLARVTIPEQALRAERREHDVEFGSILVPVFGNALDADIMQIAGRLAGAEREEGEEQAVIEAIFVLQVPMALPIDAALPEERVKAARRALARAKAVGEEYEDVLVETATVRSRRVGQAIVEEARRRGVEVIVLAAEGLRRARGGTRFGGKGGSQDFVGDITRYVLEKAPCRVLLTAPAREDAAPEPVTPQPAAPGS